MLGYIYSFSIAHDQVLIKAIRSYAVAYLSFQVIFCACAPIYLITECHGLNKPTTQCGIYELQADIYWYKVLINIALN